MKDALRALKGDRKRLSTIASREWIEDNTKVTIPANKRNYRKQQQHLQLARGIRQLKGEMGELVSGGGRPTAEQMVREWQESHPAGKKADCIRETGLSKPTVYKWWSCEARNGTNKSRNVERGSLVQEKQEKVIKPENRDVYAEYRGISSEMDRLLRRIERMDARLKELGDTTDERLRSERKMLHHSVWEAKNELNKMYRDKK